MTWVALAIGSVLALGIWAAWEAETYWQDDEDE